MAPNPGLEPDLAAIGARFGVDSEPDLAAPYLCMSRQAKGRGAPCQLDIVTGRQGRTAQSAQRQDNPHAATVYYLRWYLVPVVRDRDAGVIFETL